MNRASVFEWHKRFREGRESVRDDERCAKSKEVRIPQLIGLRVRVRVTMMRFYREFRKRFRRMCKQNLYLYKTELAELELFE